MAAAAMSHTIGDGGKAAGNRAGAAEAGQFGHDDAE